jgi:hypothetical protein
VVEECAHSVHDALFLPSEKSCIFSISFSEVQGSIVVKESKGVKPIYSCIIIKDSTWHKLFFLN